MLKQTRSLKQGAKIAGSVSTLAPLMLWDKVLGISGSASPIKLIIVFVAKKNALIIPIAFDFSGC